MTWNVCPLTRQQPRQSSIQDFPHKNMPYAGKMSELYQDSWPWIWFNLTTRPKHGSLRNDSLTHMTRNSSDPDLDGYVDWIVYDRSWGAFSEDCSSLEEAQELAGRTGGGPVFRRTWVQE